VGVAERTWSTWEKRRGITIGRSVSLPGRPGQVKLYAIDELERAAAELRAMMGQEREAFPPAGFVGREAARRIFGISLGQWTTWESRGRITCGKLVPIPGKPGTCKIYPRAALEQLKAQWDREAAEMNARLEPYPDPERPGVWRVPVKRETDAPLEALIDAADLPLIQGKRWNWSAGKSGSGSVVVAIDGSPKPSLPRILLGISDGDQQVTHRNGDRLDCRRENLVRADACGGRAWTAEGVIARRAAGELAVQGRLLARGRAEVERDDPGRREDDAAGPFPR
jgi:hypothetical protein